MRWNGRFLTCLLLLLSLALTIPAAAQDEGALDLAQYIPADATFYIALPLPTADQIYAMADLQSMLQPSAVSPRQQIDDALAQVGTTLDEVLGAFGEHVAVAALPNVDPVTGQQESLIIVEVDDAARIRELIAEGSALSGAPMEATEQDGYTVYAAPDSSSSVFLNDSLMIMQSGESAAPSFPLEASLLDSAAFTDTLALLPEESYDMVSYADLPALMAMSAGMSAEGPMAMGATTLADGTSLLDMAFAGQQATTAAINPDFVRHIPADASFVAHGADIQGLLNVLDTLSMMSGTGQSAEQMLAPGFESIGLSFEEDFLSWLGTDYALFARIEPEPMIEAAMSQRGDLSGAFDFGVLLSASDEAGAAEFAQFIGALAQAGVAQQQQQQTGMESGLEVTSETVEGTDVTMVSFSTPPLDLSLSMDVGIGAGNGVFFVATRPTLTPILTGAGSLADDPVYQEAQQYVLPSPSFEIYMTGDGMIFGVGGITVGVLALLGPAIGNVYDNIADELENPDGAYKPGDTLARQQDPTAQIVDLLTTAADTTRSATLSATITEDGTTLVRFAATPNTQ